MLLSILIVKKLLPEMFMKKDHRKQTKPSLGRKKVANDKLQVVGYKWQVTNDKLQVLQVKIYK